MSIKFQFDFHTPFWRLLASSLVHKIAGTAHTYVHDRGHAIAVNLVKIFKGTGFQPIQALYDIMSCDMICQI